MPYSTKNQSKQGNKKTGKKVQSRAPRKTTVRPPPAKGPSRTKAASKSGSSRKNGSGVTRRRPKFGEKIGEFLGGVAKSTIGTIFGRGEYTGTLSNELGVQSSEIAHNDYPEVNSLVEPVNSDVVSHMHTQSEGCVRVTRREFVEFLELEDSELSYERRIDPTRAASFPWLSTVAQNWQQYQILGLAHEYVPTSGFAVSTDSAALGQVVMGYKYDVTRTDVAYPAGDTRALLNQSGAVSMSPGAPGTCFLECDPTQTNQPVKFIRSNFSGVEASSQQNFDSAVLMIITGGAQNGIAKQCGQLWVTYDILLYHPTIPAAATLVAQILRDPIFIKYQPLAARLAQLDMHGGPYTTDEFITRHALMKVLRAKCESDELVERRALWMALMEAKLAVEEEGHTDQPLLDYIHASDTYAMVSKINPPAPTSQEREDLIRGEHWESVSQASHR